MNKKMMAKSTGQLRKLRPHVIRIYDAPGTPSHGRRDFLDDDWFITNAQKDKLDLTNTRTGHVLSLGGDHIFDYRTNPYGPGFLYLRSQIYAFGIHLRVEPLARPYGIRTYARRAPSRKPVSASR